MIQKFVFYPSCNFVIVSCILSLTVFESGDEEIWIRTIRLIWKCSWISMKNELFKDDILSSDSHSPFIRVLYCIILKGITLNKRRTRDETQDTRHEETKEKRRVESYTTNHWRHEGHWTHKRRMIHERRKRLWLKSTFFWIYVSTLTSSFLPSAGLSFSMFLSLSRLDWLNEDVDVNDVFFLRVREALRAHWRRQGDHDFQRRKTKIEEMMSSLSFDHIEINVEWSLSCRRISIPYYSFFHLLILAFVLESSDEKIIYIVMTSNLARLTSEYYLRIWLYWRD